MLPIKRKHITMIPKFLFFDNMDFDDSNIMKGEICFYLFVSVPKLRDQVEMN